MILVAGVGYAHTSDLAFGPMLVERLQRREWPPRVEVEDLSYGPIAVVQWFQDQPGKFERAMFAGAIERGRRPGTLTRYEWRGDGLAPVAVQERVAEAVTGVISLENLLIIADHFDVLPPRTEVIEFEPVELQWGLELSDLAAARLEEALDWIVTAVSRADQAIRVIQER